MGIFKSKPAKSQQSSLSENVNNPAITGAYSPQISEGTGANNFMSRMLGVVPDTGGTAQAGFNNYLQNAGYVPAMNQLAKKLTGQMAAAGALGSGRFGTALQERGAELNQGFYNNYLQQLSGLSGQGLQAGGLVANTGQKSTSQGTSVGGSPSVFGQIMDGIGQIGSTVGKLAPIFSDRRLKRDIVKLGEEADGLGRYSFRFVGETERHVGVMADEVEKIRPWAMGPKKAGFSTVDYEAL